MSIRRFEHSQLLKAPPLSRMIYDLYFKYYVDFKTGIAGLSYHVSYSDIANTVNYKGSAGIKGIFYSEKQIRNAINWLIKLGLISVNLDQREYIQGKRHSKTLVFALATLTTLKDIKDARRQLLLDTKAFTKNIEFNDCFRALNKKSGQQVGKNLNAPTSTYTSSTEHNNHHLTSQVGTLSLDLINNKKTTSTYTDEKNSYLNEINFDHNVGVWKSEIQDVNSVVNNSLAENAANSRSAYNLNTHNNGNLSFKDTENNEDRTKINLNYQPRNENFGHQNFENSHHQPCKFRMSEGFQPNLRQVKALIWRSSNGVLEKEHLWELAQNKQCINDFISEFEGNNDLRTQAKWDLTYAHNHLQIWDNRRKLKEKNERLAVHNNELEVQLLALKNAELKDNLAYEQSKFSVTIHFIPGAGNLQRWQQLLTFNNLGDADVTAEILAEFKDYWSNNPLKQTQVRWEKTLLKAIKYAKSKENQANSLHKSASSGKKKSSGKQQAHYGVKYHQNAPNYKSCKLSLVEKSYLTNILNLPLREIEDYERQGKNYQDILEIYGLSDDDQDSSNVIVDITPSPNLLNSCFPRI